MKKYKILYVEDDKDTRQMVKIYLEFHGFHIIEAENGNTALYLLDTEKIDLILLDIVLPDMNGIELLKKWKNSVRIPIVILSSRNKYQDQVIGYNEGAIDYIPKPFDLQELFLRILSKIKYWEKIEGQNERIESITLGNVMLDIKRREVTIGTKTTSLTLIESSLLRLLMEKKGQIVSYQQMYEYVNEVFRKEDTHTIQVHIYTLRHKLGGGFVKNKRGEGYFFEELGA